MLDPLRSLWQSHKFFYRPLTLLYPIECSDHQDNPVNLSHSVVNSDDNESEEIHPNNGIIDDASTEDCHATRPTCKATVVVRQRLKQWLNPDDVLISLGSVVDHAR